MQTECQSGPGFHEWTGVSWTASTSWRNWWQVRNRTKILRKRNTFLSMKFVTSIVTNIMDSYYEWGDKTAIATNSIELQKLHSIPPWRLSKRWSEQRDESKIEPRVLVFFLRGLATHLKFSLAYFATISFVLGGCEFTWKHLQIKTDLCNIWWSLLLKPKHLQLYGVTNSPKNGYNIERWKLLQHIKWTRYDWNMPLICCWCWTCRRNMFPDKKNL